MMDSVPHVGASPQDLSVPMPSPLRALLYALLVFILAVSVYVCVEMAMMVYDFYQIIQWLGGLPHE